MTVAELKEHLVNAHARDRNLTFIAYSIVTAILIALVFILLTYDIIRIPGYNEIIASGEEYGNESFNYLKFVLPLAFLSILIYPVTQLYKIFKRPQRIDTFIERIEEGAIANSIDQKTVYKIIIPLLKINLKLYPVEYVKVTLIDDITRFHNFPIPFKIIPDLKIILSGVNRVNLDKSWFELYTDENQVDTIEEEIKTEEAFRSFLDNELLPELTALENERAKGKKKYILFLIPVVLIIIGWMAFIYLKSSGQFEFSNQTMIIGFVAIFGLFYLFVFLFFIRGRSRKLVGGDMAYRFKMNIFKRMVEFINPGFHFVLHGHLNLGEILTTGIFEKRNYEISGNDQIIGKHKGVPFQLCDLSLQFKRNFSKEDDGPDHVFKGQAFIARFNKPFTSELYLIPKKTSMFSKRKNDIKDYINPKGTKVTLEDPEFMKMYNVYCTDQIDARYILSTSLMERIKTLAKKDVGDLFISFKDDRVSIFNNNGRNNFETSMFKSLVKDDLMVKFYRELTGQLRIIEGLKLNVKIWKK